MRLGACQVAILRAIGKLAPNAYGVSIRQALEERRRVISFTRIYIALDRLERAGYLVSGKGTGRKNRYYVLTQKAHDALRVTTARE